MAGLDSGFSADDFRSAVKFAMQMGAPEDENMRATFRWTERKTFANPDPNGSPYDWGTSPITDTTPDDVIVDVAVEFSGAFRSSGTDAGPFSFSRATLTVLDVDYELIRGSNEVVLGGDVYDIIAEPMPQGLFDVTVYTLVAAARSAA